MILSTFTASGVIFLNPQVIEAVILVKLAVNELIGLHNKFGACDEFKSIVAVDTDDGVCRQPRKS